MAEKLYVFYSKGNDPFPGFIRFTGFVDTAVPPDGSTMKEHLTELLTKYPNSGVKLLPKDTPMPDSEAVKFNWQTLEFQPLDLTDLTPDMREAAKKAQRALDILDALPDWATAKNAIDVAFTDPKQNAIVTKQTKILFWLAKNNAD